MTERWDPDQYDRFREERQQPFYDLLKLVIPKKNMRILDLGCGTGQLTREMHRHLKASATLGVDSSEAMLAGTTEQKDNGLSFQNARIEDTADDQAWDLVFSNAAIHWVPDHATVFEKLARAIAPGGQLAVQMPANQDHLTRIVADVVAREEPFARALGGVGVRQHVLPVESYAPLLSRLGFRTQNVRLQVYLHKLSSRDDVVEWVKGAMLTDLKGRLSAELYQEFLKRYADRLIPRLEDTRPFLYTFKRVFLWAERG